MKQEVLMPKLGESITEGTIVKWWKQPGDYVKKEETLLEISTDKVDSEIPSPFEGVLVSVNAKENDTVTVDEVIAVIDTEGEAANRGNGQQDETELKSKKQEAVAPLPVDTTTDEKETETSPAPVQSAAGGVVEMEMPKLGESITEGTIVKWWKNVGDVVKKDETLLEISTDKVDSEIPSPFDGTVREIVAKEGETVPVGSVIAKIVTGEGVAAQKAPVTSPPAAIVSADPPLSSPSNGDVEPVSPQTIPATPEKRSRGSRFYSPLVRSIARKEGISVGELEGIPGSGLDGRVTKNDILNYIGTGRVSAPTATKPSPVAQPGTPQTSPTRTEAAPAKAPEPLPSTEEVKKKFGGQRVEVVPMDNIRKRIADHMVKSKHTSPHVYGVAEVDFTNAMDIVKKHRDGWKQRENMKLTVNPMILYCVAKALNDFPDINVSIEGHNIIKRNYVNIGMAVATERGLLVPVLKNADELNFRGVARNAYDLAIRTRDKKLKPDDVQGATFTVTNYGVFGNVIGFPIINQPNVAILGVGAIKKRPVVVETEYGDLIAIRQIGFLTLSYDHRIVDGELGDKYIQRVRHYLENFQEDWL